MKIFVLTLVLLNIVFLNSAQNNQDPFILAITSLDLNRVLCYGTLLTNRHVLTAASCLTPIMNRVNVIRNGDVFTAERIFIHPSFRRGQDLNFNVAIIQTTRNIPTRNLPLLPLDVLPSNTTCGLFGWGHQWDREPRSEVVSIYSSTFCDPNFPQVSCSNFDATNNEPCTALVGSPVFCQSNTRFTGFKISQGCITGQNQQIINYHSVNTFTRWIEEVIRTDSQRFDPTTASVVEFVPGSAITPRVRCAATFINDHHVLTTATCVNLPKNSIFEIGVQASWMNIGSSQSQTEEIFIHPNFTQVQPRAWNVAVIRTVGRTWMQQFASIGSLPANNVTDNNFCNILRVEDFGNSWRSELVTIYQPQFCRANLPQVFCSAIDQDATEVCSMSEGSPVICGNGRVFAGVLLSNRACNPIGEFNGLEYHSVGEFREWIEEVSSAGKLGAMTILILSVTSMTLNHIF